MSPTVLREEGYRFFMEQDGLERHPPNQLSLQVLLGIPVEPFH